MVTRHSGAKRRCQLAGNGGPSARGASGPGAGLGAQCTGAFGVRRAVALQPLTARCPGGPGSEAAHHARSPGGQPAAAAPAPGTHRTAGAGAAETASERWAAAPPDPRDPGSPLPRPAGSAERLRALTVRCRWRPGVRPLAGPSPRPPLARRRSPSLAGPRRRGRPLPHGRPARGAGPPSSNAAAPPVRTRTPAPRMRRAPARCASRMRRAPPAPRRWDVRTDGGRGLGAGAWEASGGIPPVPESRPLVPTHSAVPAACPLAPVTPTPRSPCSLRPQARRADCRPPRVAPPPSRGAVTPGARLCSEGICFGNQNSVWAAVTSPRP